MHIDVRSTNIDLPSGVRARFEKRLRAALARFASRIHSVDAVFTDINGPRGGIDSTCRLNITGYGPWAVRVSATEIDVARAIADTIARAKPLVAERVRRYPPPRVAS